VWIRKGDCGTALCVVAPGGGEGQQRESTVEKMGTITMSADKPRGGDGKLDLIKGLGRVYPRDTNALLI